MHRNDMPTLVKDCYDAIMNDDYMWVCIWGEPRKGKTTLALLTMYYIYKDWNKVLNAIGFSLNQTIYRIRNGVPELWPTRNGLHRRVPVLLWDDFGAHSNKARTQHKRSWDIFKGGFDVLGTKVGVLLATMVQPSEATQQIAEKYTHEIWVDSRGHYKYDRWHQHQDYHGFRAKGSKEWLDEQFFVEIPEDVFQLYDEMRQALADEIFVAIDDAAASTEVDEILKRLQTDDIQLMQLIRQLGPVSRYHLKEEMGDKGRQAVTRLKARDLVVAIEVSRKEYSYDLTNLGIDTLKTIEDLEKQKPLPETAPRTVSP